MGGTNKAKSTEEVVAPKHGLRSVFQMSTLRRIPLSTLSIAALYLIVLVAGTIAGVELTFLISGSLAWFCLWALFVLSNVPTIQAGMGPNFALPIGIAIGVFSMVISMGVLELAGWMLIIAATLIAAFLGCGAGALYGRLLNAVKGSEMAIATYTGFAAVFLFSLVWVTIQVRHEEMTWFLIPGLRQTISLAPFEANFILTNLWQFTIFPNEIINAETGETIRRFIALQGDSGYFDYYLMEHVGETTLQGGIVIRTGEKLVIFVAAILMWMFFRTKRGVAISAVGSNPVFSKATGVDVDKSRITATMISTVLGALGIIVYAQGFGNLQLYDAPLMMSFPVVASVLVGGATAQRAKVANVIIGTLLFKGLMFVSMPVLIRIFPGTQVVDPIRMVIQYSVILYALTRMKGGGN